MSNEHLDQMQESQAGRCEAWSTVLLGLLVVALMLVPLRVVQLQCWPDAALARAAGRTESTAAAMARRGDVLDRRGRVLATSTLGWRVFVDPAGTDDPGLIGAHLAGTVGLDAGEVDRKLSRRLDSRFVPVSDVLADAQVDGLRQNPIRGVGLEPRPIRHYPNGMAGGSLIGLVGFDHTGLAGIEHRQQRRLEGRSGTITAVRDTRRRTLWVHPTAVDAPTDGDDIRLSIDLAIQNMAEERLAAAVRELGAAGGRLVIVDPATGELLAVADMLADDHPDRSSDRRLDRNRCATDPYEPGSTFKPFIWAAALEAGVVREQEVLPTPSDRPHRTSRGRRIRDAHYEGPSTFRRVLVRSLNSGMAIVAERLSEDAVRTLVARLGFGRSTGCGLPGETGGIVTPESRWSHYTQTSVAMGHEISVTTLQLSRAFCAFARDGTVPDLTLLARSDGAPLVQQRIFKPETVTAARSAMREVMLEGTGRRVQSGLYSMFGKSGTAQLPIAEGGGYHEDRYISSFIAAAPVEDPALVVLCVIDDPDRSKGRWYGSSTAGPVVRDLVEQALPYLGVAPDLERDPT
ncbi:MAG: penicillin-binding protein 2 [Phycisphaerales bacterium]|nr:penicillin-binding protein 2 [Phycisphaerales bacterium]